MESNKINYKKILLWFITILGMILTALFTATVIFFNSIPVRSTHHQSNHNFTSEAPDSTFKAAGEPTSNPSVQSGSRDPFLPPASAWPNLTAAKDFSNNPRESKPRPLSKKNRTNPKKQITSDNGKKTSKKAKVTPKITVTLTPTIQPDQNFPEYKETLILPEVNQGNNEIYKTTYLVKKGETIRSISQKFGVDTESIFNSNHLALNNKLTEGGILTIPIPENHLYRLKPNETLWRIATRYGIAIELLKEINNITDLTKLKTEQIIILPVSVEQIANKKY